MAHRLLLLEAHNMDERLRHIRVPSLILAGDRDVMVSTKSLRELENGIANSKLVRIPGSGHLASVTKPAVVAQHVVDFYQEASGELIPDSL